MTKNNVVGNGFSLPELKAERSSLFSRIKILDNLIKAIEEYEESSGLPSAQNNGSALEDNSDLSNVSAYEGCVRILAEKGKSMKTRQLLEELERRGKVSEAANKLTSLYSSLFGALHKKEVVKNKDGSWGLSTWNS